MKKSFLSLMLFFSLTLVGNTVKSQSVDHIYILNQVAKKHPETVVNEKVLYVINGHLYRQKLEETDSLLSQFDISFDSVEIFYMTREKLLESFYQAISDLIIVNATRHVTKRKQVKKELRNALDMYKDVIIRTAHGPLFKSHPEVVINNSVMAMDQSYGILKELDKHPSQVLNIKILDISEVDSLTNEKANALIKIRLRTQ